MAVAWPWDAKASASTWATCSSSSIKRSFIAPSSLIRATSYHRRVGKFFPRDRYLVKWHTQDPSGTKGPRCPETRGIWRVFVSVDHIESADRPPAQQDVKDVVSHPPLFDGHPRMRAIRSVIESIADTDTTVLIRGESGVGKDLVARAVHAASARRAGPFIKVNCAAIPQGLLESELFGHEKGAFTGAYRRKPGQFEYANKGTIYLDEIGELPLALQAKLLHVLQDFRFMRVGGHQAIEVDARVIAATNRDLEEAIARGEFREDLYYRLNVVEVRIPPLRERREDIAPLVSRFLALFNQQYDRNKRVSPETMVRLIEYPWPGNVRKLENIIRRIVVLSDGEQ